MIIDHEIKEHRIQATLSECLKHKRVAERTSKGKAVQYKCIKSKAELEVNVDGSKTIKKLILE
ncbi:MAG TPA: hypothetical protein DEA86_09790 [Deltaproteobacteria bacterium]|jgi:hypothetical protein|nr:hypothetical protein [Deltaproteobacteria bacterium]